MEVVHQIYLWVSLWDIFLINDGCGRCHPCIHGSELYKVALYAHAGLTLMVILLLEHSKRKNYRHESPCLARDSYTLYVQSCIAWPSLLSALCPIAAYTHCLFELKFMSSCLSPSSLATALLHAFSQTLDSFACRVVSNTPRGTFIFRARGDAFCFSTRQVFS